MGCCNSREAEDGPEPSESSQQISTLETHHPISSTRAIAPSAVPPTSAQSRTRSLRPRPSVSTNNSTPRPSTNLAEQPNAPLRQPAPWTSKKRLWTPSQLTRERYEFFETRVTGNEAIWAALRTACELMRDGDIATAQEILTAAGVTMPSGDLVNGAWDAQGNLYRIPPEILLDPENIVDDSKEQKTTILTEAKDSTLSLDKELEPGSLGSTGAAEDKGKYIAISPPSEGGPSMKVKCRLSDRGGADLVITISPMDPVTILAREAANQGNISGKQRVRIAYLGRMLKEHETLESQGYKKGHVVNALVVTDSDDT